jgi:hypothetical protein
MLILFSTRLINVVNLIKFYVSFIVFKEIIGLVIIPQTHTLSVV